MKSLFRSRLVRANSGFTLAELMLVIGITTVTLAIAIPAYHLNIKPTAHLNGAARQLHGDIQLARLRAVSESTQCGVAFSAGPSYTVFRDNNPANAQYDAGTEDVIKTVNLVNEYKNVQFDTSEGGGDGISFANNSFSVTPRGLKDLGGEDTVSLVNEKGEGRRIVVNSMGGVRLEKY
jgi:Tfp pilus assembly protein FimT